MRRSILGLCLIAAGCGEIRSTENDGEALFRISAALRGAAFPPAEGEHRALFGWVFVGGGPYVDCVERQSFLLCGPTPVYETKLSLFSASVEPKFPSGMDVLFHSLPDESMLLDRGGAKLALGGLAIYDDKNLNGELDPIGPNDVAPTDRMLAESAFSSPESVAVYREGLVHPIWAIFRDAFDCPNPPLGYSVARLDENLKCVISPEENLVITTSDNSRTDRWLCGGALVDFQLLRRSEEPLEPPPEDAAGIECLLDGMRYQYFIDEGNYCDRYKTRLFSLRGCDPNRPNHCWDLRETPPEWWPCRR
jgi:hypothetical protein